MTILSSGLWCDLCRTPILAGEWWYIKVNGKKGHACGDCKKKYQKESV